MGGIAVAGRDDDVIFYNPSQLAIARGTSFSVGRMSSGTRGGTMSTVIRLGTGGFGLGVNHLEYRTDSNYPPTLDGVVEPNPLLGASTLAAVGFAQVLRGVRIGVTAKYAVDQIGSDRYRAVAGDLGLSRDFAGYFTGGLSFQHLGSPTELATGLMRPPTRITLGVAGTGPVGPLDLVLTSAAMATREAVTGAIGVEAGWSWLSGYNILARGGYRTAGEAGAPRFTTGAGVVIDRLALDFGVDITRSGRRSGRAGLRIR
jgi:hypothetical protein